MTALDRIFFKCCFLLSLLLAGGMFVAAQRTLPEFGPEAIFYIGIEGEENARLMAYDKSANNPLPLTPEKFIVNQFSLVQTKNQKGILFLAVDRRDISKSSSWYFSQTLYFLDLLTGKMRKVRPTNTFSHDAFYPHPNGKVFFFKSDRSGFPKSLWRYDVQRKAWNAFQPGKRLQDVQFSPDGNWILAVDGSSDAYHLFPFFGKEASSTPVGNFLQSFGFNQEGKKILFSQTPNQDIFSRESYLVVFHAGGSATELLKDRGNINQATWGDKPQEIFAVVREGKTEGKKTETLLRINSETGLEEELASWEDAEVSWMRFQKGKLWLIVKTEDLSSLAEYDGTGDLQDMLDTFAEREQNYQVLRLDPETKALETLPIKGLLPQQF